MNIWCYKTFSLLLLVFSVGHPAVVAAAKETKIPTAYITAGGGFKTMTESMGIIRAVYEQDLLPLITHFGCVSGGGWFQSQFSYSRNFYETNLGLTGLTVDEAVGEWGKLYSIAMKEAVILGLFEDVKFTLEFQSDLCALNFVDINGTSIVNVIDAAVNGFLDLFAFPASNWFYYNQEMLSTYIPFAAEKTLSTTRHGHPRGTIVSHLTLAPDIYDNTAQEKPNLIGRTPGVDLLPISCSAAPGKDGEWKFPATDTDTLQVQLGSETVDLDLSPQASIAEVFGGSSSFIGYVGSPTLFANLISNTLNTNPLFDNLTTAEKFTLETAIDFCLPLGMQNLSSPTDGNVASTTTSWSPKFRYMDGGVSDGSGIVSTISRMQLDCAKNDTEYDCEETGIRVIALFGSGEGLYDTIPRQFANCSCGNSNNDDLGGAISPQIFAEAYPSDLNDPGWTLYSNISYAFAPDNETTLSYAWRGTVTTVDNPGWGVTAGMKVDLVLLFGAQPSNEPVSWPGAAAEYGFTELYGVIAQEQYDTLGPYFQELAQDWLPLSSTGGKKAGKKSYKEPKTKKAKKSKNSNRL